MIVFIVVIYLISNTQLAAKEEVVQEKNKKKTTIHVIAERQHVKNLNEKAQVIGFSESTYQAENYISDIFNKQSGITINRYGAPGSFSELSIRGSYARQTNIYIDGILLNDALGGFTNLEELPIDFFSRMELYRSYIPTHLPGNNIGGAIDLIPKFSTGKEERSLSFRTFAHSLYGGGFGIGLMEMNQVHLVNFEGSLNQYDYLDDNGTKQINFTDDTIRRRKNEDYLQVGYIAIFRIPVTNKNLKVLFSYLGKKRGIPGPLGFSLHSVRYETHRLIIKPSVDYAFSSNSLLNFSTGFAGEYSHLDDAENELLFLRPQQQRRYSLRAQGSLKHTLFVLSKKLRINSSFLYAHNQLYLQEQTLGRRSEVENGLSVGYTHSKWLGYFVAGGKYIYVADKTGEIYHSTLFVQPSLDTKSNHLLGGNFKWGVYPLYIFDVVDTIETKGKDKKNSKKKEDDRRRKSLEFFTMVSYAERTPSLSEFYGDGSFILPNSELENESSITYTAGLSGGINYEKTSCSFSISYFHARSENLIILISSSRRNAKYFNISGSYSDGLEFDLKLAYSDYLQLDIKTSYLRAIDNSSISFYKGKFLPLKPMYSLSTYLEGGFKELRSFVNFSWQTQIYRDRFNQRTSLIPNRFLFDVGLIYFFPDKEKYSIIFKVKNILGLYQSDVLDYPLPGRTFEIKCTGHWS